MKRLPLPLVFALVVMAAGSVESREPSELEQYYLELVNRARANPGAEVTRLAGEVWGDTGSPAVASLNEGLAPGTIIDSAKPPLAFDTRLIDSASDYADFLLATEQFDHDLQGTPSTRIKAAGYTLNPPAATGENLATTASGGPHPVNKDRVDAHHEGLFIDGDVPGRGHRRLLLDEDFREIGIAIRADSDNVSSFGPGLNEVVSTQNLALSSGRLFVTGVLYYDNNTNNFFDPGESAGILELTVKTLADATVASGTSFGSGGYSINLNGVPAATYKLVARDALGFEESVNFIWGGTVNVKADLKDPVNLVAAPVLGNPFRPDGRIGRSLTTFSGNDVFSDSPAGQSLTQTTRSARSTTWHARIESDGNQFDTVRTVATRSSRFFRILYLRQDGVALLNTTAALVAGFNDGLQPGEETALRILVKPERRALGRRTGQRFNLRSVSVNDGSKVDRINGSLLNRTPRPRR